MAIVQNPLIGRASGKFSGAVFSKMYDKNVIRSKPVVVRDKKSDSQISQRSKFKVAQVWVIMFLTIIRSGFAGMAVNMSAYAYALGWYMTNAITGTPGNWSINYSAAKFSFGDLQPLSPSNLAGNGDGSFVLEWLNSLGSGNGSDLDIVHVIVFNETQNSMYHFSDNLIRSDAGVDVLPPSVINGDTLHVWCYSTNVSLSLISTSEYCGEITLSF